MFLISLFLMISFACQKENVLSDFELNGPGFEEIDNNISKSLKPIKMVPLKGEIIEIGTGEPVSCFGIPYSAHYLDIGGHVTHLGNVEGGYGNLTNCRMEVRDEVPTIIVDVDGQLAAANGDALFYEGELTVIFVDQVPVVTNVNSITGGIGRWEHASGYFENFFQPQEDGTLLISILGEVSSPGSLQDH